MAWGTFDENAVDGIVENGQNALVCPQCGCKEGNLTIFGIILRFMVSLKLELFYFLEC